MTHTPIKLAVVSSCSSSRSSKMYRLITKEKISCWVEKYKNNIYKKMMIDRWKACGWRTNKQWRKEIKEWWEITWITLKNNIKIMKSQSDPF